MKPRTLLLLTPALCLGCLGLPKQAPKAAAPAVTAQKPKSPAPVLPEQVNDKNARQKLEALRDELDRATQEAYDKPKDEAQVSKAK